MSDPLLVEHRDRTPGARPEHVDDVLVGSIVPNCGRLVGVLAEVDRIVVGHRQHPAGEFVRAFLAVSDEDVRGSAGPLLVAPDPSCHLLRLRLTPTVT
jgi:hypothetical protein